MEYNFSRRRKTMNNITTTKSITGTIVGVAAALALAACTSGNSVAPEASIAQTSSEPSAQIRISPTDSTYTPPIIAVSAETEETLESWLKGNPISNMIHVDYWCAENPDFPDDHMWCLPSKIQLESGTVLDLYTGNANVIACATGQDTIIYSVQLHSNIITKRWNNPFFGTDSYTRAKEEFTHSCKAEFGDITENTENTIACDIKIKPTPSSMDSTAQSPRYLRPRPPYNYDDPSWTDFATKAIERCRTRPQIEPIETF